VAHIGIDLGATRSHILVLSAKGEVKQRLEVLTPELPSWLKKQKRSRVVMEACTQSTRIAEAARTAKHETVVVPGQVVRALGVGARGIKTDYRDAEALARASLRSAELPSVHTRSEASRSQKELLSARATLVKSRGRISLQIKSWLRGRLVNLSSRANSPYFAKLVRELAVSSPEGLPLAFDILLTTYEHLTGQIDQLDEQLESIAKADDNCKRAITMPGIGHVTALAFIAAVDDPNRFSSSEQLASYMGLVPGEATTGGKLVRTSTIKAGPKYLRSLLVQCAWVAWRTKPNDPMVLWAKKIADKRGNRIAILALARKMSTVLWAMWKSNTNYDPSRASSVRAERNP
jgi:transposase